jgi:hypothetical protein
MGPAHAKPNVVARVAASSLGLTASRIRFHHRPYAHHGMALDLSVVGNDAWALETNMGPSSNSLFRKPAAPRRRPHRTHQVRAALYQRPPDSNPQVRAAGPPRQDLFPCSSPSLSPSTTSPTLALPRCSHFIRTALLSYLREGAPFCQPEPRIAAAVHPYPRRCRFASGSRTSPHACMRPPGLRSPTPPRYTNTTAQMPARFSALL